MRFEKTPIPEVPVVFESSLTATNWIAIGAAIVALLSLLVAWRASQHVGKYRDPSWKLEMIIPEAHERPWTFAFDLINIGETRAEDVKITFDFDPTALNVRSSLPLSRALEWGLVEQAGRVRIEMDWMIMDDDPVRRINEYANRLTGVPARAGATVTCKSVLGRTSTKRVLLPTVTPEMWVASNAWVFSWREEQEELAQAEAAARKAIADQR